VRSHFRVPKVDRRRWRLVVDGAVDRPTTFRWEDLRALPRADVTAVLECAGNSRSYFRPWTEGVPWGHGAVGAARWAGVRLREILTAAGVRPAASDVVFAGADRGREPGVSGEIRYAMSISLAKALDPDTLVADEMNGEALTAAHGFPARALVPGWFGMASVKWLARITVLDRPFSGYFRRRAYAYLPLGATDGPAATPATWTRVKSLITSPGEGARLPVGRCVVRGLAWSGESPIASVEVRVDPAPAGSATWRAARLLPSTPGPTWRRWEAACDLPRSGFFVIRARATDGTGSTQAEQAAWNYRGIGNNAIHAVPVEVGDGLPGSAGDPGRATTRPRRSSRAG
jgi:DMSO/TMAO reductase YedYZ molybdopterin-dependent catalytic subunit